MSERFNATDIAVGRRLRALEDASDAAIRASADLIATMLDARQARRLPAARGHDTLARVGGIMADAIALRGASVLAHAEVSGLGQDLGLPITALGDTCQDDIATLGTTGLRSVSKTA